MANNKNSPLPKAKNQTFENIHYIFADGDLIIDNGFVTGVAEKRAEMVMECRESLLLKIIERYLGRAVFDSDFKRFQLVRREGWDVNTEMLMFEGKDLGILKFRITDRLVSFDFFPSKDFISGAFANAK